MARHFLALHDYNEIELFGMLTLARELKEKQKRGVPHRLLGGHGLFISSANSQMGRGEPIKDTARVMARYCDGVMIRTYGQEIVEEFARYSSVPIINGLTDLFHPCQIMADLLTVIEHKRTYEGLTFAWVGDGNNMANTWIEAAAILGFDLRLACPQGFGPDAKVMAWAQAQAPGRITLTTDPRIAVSGADIINTDVWASMGQESEQKEREQAFAGYCLDDALLGLAKPDCIVLHCLPAHRGEEISDSVIEGNNSVVWDEAENRLHIQKAIMATLIT